ncbi:MAG: hypothetical protein ACJ748_13735 [Flavisolibacter sp.]
MLAVLVTLPIVIVYSCDSINGPKDNIETNKLIKDTVRIYDYTNMFYQFQLRLFKDSFEFIKKQSDSIKGTVDYDYNELNLNLNAVQSNRPNSDIARQMTGVLMVKTFQFNEVAPLLIVPNVISYSSKFENPAKSTFARYYRGTGYSSFYINLYKDSTLEFFETNDQGQNDTVVGNWSKNNQFIYLYNLPANSSIFKYSQNGLFFIFGEVLIGRKVELKNHTLIIRSFYFVKK